MPHANYYTNKAIFFQNKYSFLKANTISAESLVYTSSNNNIMYHYKWVVILFQLKIFQLKIVWKNTEYVAFKFPYAAIFYKIFHTFEN